MLSHMCQNSYTVVHCLPRHTCVRIFIELCIVYGVTQVTSIRIVTQCALLDYDLMILYLNLLRLKCIFFFYRY